MKIIILLLIKLYVFFFIVKNNLNVNYGNVMVQEEYFFFLI